MKRSRFWVVWNSSNHISSARHQHSSREMAQHEAERLAKANPGYDFIVLKAVGGASAKSPKLDRLAFEKFEDDGIPF